MSAGNEDGRFPGLREGSTTRWAEVMRSVKVSIWCLRAGLEYEDDIWSDGEGSDNDDWVLPLADGDDDVSSDSDEEDGGYTDASAAGRVTDGEMGLEHPRGRTTSHVGDDQIDHHNALEIFEKSLERVNRLPRNEDFGGEVEEASPPAPAPVTQMPTPTSS